MTETKTRTSEVKTCSKASTVVDGSDGALRGPRSQPLTVLELTLKRMQPLAEGRLSALVLVASIFEHLDVGSQCPDLLVALHIVSRFVRQTYVLRVIKQQRR